ncbi:hypothetical protein LCGC14_2232850 [marine sediment metagenome]|uniref:Uncharacterized protein n=1 Tax=marine sediment metagenome TaxID=412755 RepID=A0A0F9D7W5_9ZZZZ
MATGTVADIAAFRKALSQMEEAIRELPPAYRSRLLWLLLDMVEGIRE